MKTRRDLLRSALLGGAAVLGSRIAGAQEQGGRSDKDDDDLASAKAARKAPGEKAKHPLKLLILGGTGFLGPHLVEYARSRGHTVTLFNRGKTRPELFPDLEKLRGDRKEGKLDALKGRKWDSVIDTSGYVPRIVRQSAALLAPNVKQYQFVSSISVFPEEVKPDADETTPVQKLADPATEDIPKHYGALKAACEAAVESVLPGRAFNVRPGLIVGPGDPTDRYTYWPVRIDKGGEAIAPGDGSDPVQYVDARDLAAWMVRMAEQNTDGIFNAVGPEKKQTVREMLAACEKAAANPAKLVWLPAKFLEEQKVMPWMELPVWTGGDNGFARINCKKAIQHGLTFRSAGETAKDTLAWWKTLPEKRTSKLRAGLAPEKEQAVLAAFRARKG